MQPSTPSPNSERAQYTRNQELRSFLFLTVVMAPVLTGMLIAGYGFLVWMVQLISGPPTGG
jgi:nitrate reductase NapE